MNFKPALLVTGFSTWGTGYNRVLLSLFEYWSNDYEIHFVGVGLPPKFESSSIKYYPATLKGGFALGVFECETLINEIKPKIVLLLNDLLRIVPIVKRLAIYRPSIKLLVYFPMEGELKSSNFVEPLQFADQIITYTDFGKRELLKAEIELQKKNSYFLLPPIMVLGHGVDTNKFKPTLKKNKRLVPSYLKNKIEINDDTFVILNANQFQYRKQIKTTLEGFFLFAKNKTKNVYLILHHTLLGVAGYRAVENLILNVAKSLKCEDSIIDQVIISPVPELNAIEDSDLVKLYNLSDVGINTSGGEGWGLVSFEHAATGAAQIMPNHPACFEIWNNEALFIDRMEELETSDDFSMKLFKVNHKQLANHLEDLYRNREFLKKIGHLCYKNSKDAKYDWRVIAMQWLNLFNQQSIKKTSDSPLPVHFNFRKDTIDSAVFRIVVQQNEYNLPSQFNPDDIVIDIGAHIGSFSYLALQKGAKVYAYEADKSNFALLKRHLDFYIKNGKLIIENIAVWGEMPIEANLYLSKYDENGWNTGGARITEVNNGEPVKTISIDELIQKIELLEKKKIQLIKIDCEGSEWPILLGSQKIGQISQICGEYHEFGGDYDSNNFPFSFEGLNKFTETELIECLQGKGFVVEVKRKIFNNKPDRTGLFFAKQ